jgi:3-hydroxyisobutyrate dehydrogenase-like beta-hydroxyacid dehydrogenase
MTEAEKEAWKFPVKKVGVLGLGPVGGEMARVFLKLGTGAGLQTVSVFDPDAKVLEAFGADDAVRSKSVSHLIDSVDLLLLCLPKAGDVGKIARSHEGLLDCARQGQIIIDHSWSPPDLMHQLETAFAKRGAAFLDAPIGRSAQASAAIGAGQLALAISGDVRAIEAALPALRCFARMVTPVGSAGSAQVVRQMSDLVAFQTFTALTEAMAAAKTHGIDGAMMIKALAEGHGDGVGVALQSFQRFLEADQASGPAMTTIGDAEQRLTDVVRMAEAKKLALTGADGALALLKKAREKGLGDEGLRGLATVIEPEQPAWRQKARAG